MANELLYPQGFISAINNLKISAPTFAFIHVTYPEGSICTAESSDGDFLAAEDTSGEYTFAVPEPVQESATWTISCSDNNTGDSDEVDVIVDTFGSNKNAILRYADPVLNNNSWELISMMAQRGTGDNYWDVGDCKEIVLNGYAGLGQTLNLSNYTTYIYILDFNYPINKTTPDNNIIFGGFKTALINGIDIALCDNAYGSVKRSGRYYTMNHYATSSGFNYGGWKGCDFRYDILGATSTPPSLYNALKVTGTVGYDATKDTIINPITNTLIATLPNDLRTVLRLQDRYIDSVAGGDRSSQNCNTKTIDAVSLLAEFEVFGQRQYANQFEQNHQKQMAYFIAGNSTIKYRHNGTNTACKWSLASPYYNNNRNFCCVNTNGTQYGSDGSCEVIFVWALAPIFKV